MSGKRIWIAKAAVTVISVLALCFMDYSTVLAGQSVPYETYTYDYYEDVKYTPAAYVPDSTVSGDRIGCGAFASPQDIYVDGEGNVYIADTGNNRIVITDSSFKLVTVLESFQNNGQQDELSSPNGVYRSSGGNLYIADSGKNRVVELDSSWNLVQIIENPQSDVLEEGYVFTPLKVAVDYADRIYVIAKNQFEGIMAFNKEGEFTLRRRVWPPVLSSRTAS